jgi:signal transduction histidine kinase
MESLLDFLAGNICILFFANGLAFFAMGLAIALESRRVSASAISNNLLWLAGFGFAASAGNWLQMFYAGLGHGSSAAISPLGQTLKLVCFVLAATLLLEFGVRLTIAHDPKYRWLRAGFWALLAGYLAAVAIVLASAYRFGSDWISLVEVLARYLLYSPALALAGLALLAQRRDFVEMRLFAPARDAVGAALAFGLKLIVSGLVAVPILGPAGPAASAWVLVLQLVRTLTTVAIAYFVVRILRVFEMEHRSQLQREAEVRAEAQERALEVQRQNCDEIRTWSASMAEMVQTVSSAISQPLAIDEIMKIVLRETLSLAGLSLGIVHLLDDKGRMLYQVAHQGVPDWFAQALVTVKVGDGLAGWVAEKGEMLIVEDVAHDPRPFVPRTQDVYRFYMGIPLEAGGKVLGVMNLLHPQAHRLTDQQVALLEAAGKQLGVAIAGANLQKKLTGMAALEERARLSRELHDNLLQVLGYLNLKSKVLQESLPPEQRPQILAGLQDIEQVTAQAYNDMRTSILGLRVNLSLDQDFVPALEGYVHEFGKRSQLDVVLDTERWRQPLLMPETQVQLTRIVQEALTNVARHARASQVRLTFSVDDNVASIRIADNGQGFVRSETGHDGEQHLGLETMRERAESVGARLELHSLPGQGTEILITLPLNP